MKPFIDREFRFRLHVQCIVWPMMHQVSRQFSTRQKQIKTAMCRGIIHPGNNSGRILARKVYPSAIRELVGSFEVREITNINMTGAVEFHRPANFSSGPFALAVNFPFSTLVTRFGNFGPL